MIRIPRASLLRLTATPLSRMTPSSAGAAGSIRGLAISDTYSKKVRSMDPIRGRVVVFVLVLVVVV